MRASGLWVIVGALAAAGAAGWLLFGAPGGAGGADDLDAAAREEAAAGPQGPVLKGREGLKGGPAVARDEGDFPILAKVVDEQDKPVADVTVSALRRGEAYAAEDPLRWTGWNGAERLAKAFAETSATSEAEPPAASAKSGADGTVRLTVHRRGDYAVRAEPDAPRAGTEGSWYLNDKPPTAPLVLRVFAGSALRGRVIDAQDRGVAAVVRAYATPREGEDAWRARATPTEAGTGAFAFAGVPNGKVTFDVSLPGRLRVTGHAVTAPTTSEVLIRLGDAATLLTGRVKDLAGQGIAAARLIVTVNAVSAAGAAGDALSVRYFATADAEGQYAIVGPLGGPVGQVEVAATGYLYATQAPPLATWSGLDLAPGRGAVLDLTLWKGGVLDGRISEKGTGAPLAQAEITLFPAAVDGRLSRPPNLHTTTDAQGRYHLDGVPLGRSVLMVKHPTHFVPALESLPRQSNDMEGIVYSFDGVMMGGGAGGPPADLTVFVEQEGQRVVKDLELARGIPLAGRVVDAQGAPVEGAEVFAKGLGLGQRSWQWGIQSGEAQAALATSAAEGRFTIPGLPPRKDWVLYAKKKGLVGEPSQPLGLAADAKPPEVQLKLLVGATLVGRVVDERGTGVAGMDVNAWLQSGEGGFTSNEQVRTGEDGSFRLEGLATGSYGLNAWGRGRQANYLQVDGVTAGEVREGVELKLVAAVELAGVLVDENGAPVRAKTLLAQSVSTGNSSMTTSGADGAWRFHDMPAGTIRLSAGTWENNVELATVTSPAKDVRVTWKEPPQQVIEGTVVDPQGKPVPLCSVQVRQAQQAGNAMGMTWAGGGPDGSQVVNGWFRRNAQGKAPFSVTVSAPQDAQGRPLNLKGKSVPVEDPKAGPITITLEPGLEVAGRVLDPAGKPVEHVSVWIGNVRASTDASGAFALGGLAEGTAQLGVGPPSPWVRPAPVSVSAGATDVVVRLRAGLAVAGEVRGTGGKPVSSGWVNATWQQVGAVPAGNASGAVQGTEGKFRIEGIPEEATVTLQVQIWSNDGDQQYAPKTVTGIRPGTDDLVIDMASGVEVSGTVVDTQGKPFSAGWVMVTTGADEKNPSSNYVQIKDDGTFTAAGLERGPVKLSVYRNDGGPTGEAVRVDAPASRVKLTLPASTPIRGTLHGAGASAPSYRITAWTLGENRREARRVYPDADGRFSLEGVSGSGQWMVAARAKGNDSDLYALAGPFAAGTENVVLELRTGRAIEGTVASSDGAEPPAGINVMAGNDGWNGWSAVGAKGEFKIRGLPPGRYRLSCSSPDGTQEASQADVDDGSTGVRLTLKPK